MRARWAILGAAVRVARCGAFDDDLEVFRGWHTNPDGTDTAPAAAGSPRRNPSSTSSSGPKQLGTAPSGAKAYVTGAPAGDVAGATTSTGGRRSARPRSSLPAAAGQRLTFRYVFAHSKGSSAADSLRAIVERADGSQVEVFSIVGRVGRRRRRLADRVGLARRLRRHRRSAFASSRPTAGRPTCSRSSSTTSG